MFRCLLLALILILWNANPAFSQKFDPALIDNIDIQNILESQGIKYHKVPLKATGKDYLVNYIIELYEDSTLSFRFDQYKHFGKVMSDKQLKSWMHTINEKDDLLRMYLIEDKNGQYNLNLYTDNFNQRQPLNLNEKNRFWNDQFHRYTNIPKTDGKPVLVASRGACRPSFMLPYCTECGENKEAHLTYYHQVVFIYLQLIEVVVYEGE